MVRGPAFAAAAESWTKSREPDGTTAPARTFGRVIHVLNDEEIEFLPELGEAAVIDPRMKRIGGDDPQRFDFASFHRVEDLIVGERGIGRDVF